MYEFFDLFMNDSATFIGTVFIGALVLVFIIGAIIAIWRDL